MGPKIYLDYFDENAPNFFNCLGFKNYSKVNMNHKYLEHVNIRELRCDGIIWWPEWNYILPAFCLK